MNPDPSQPNDLENANVNSTPNENPSNKKLKCTKNDWTREEDLVLTKGWLHVSKQNIASYSQHKKDFWRSISAYYEKNNTSGIPRTLKKIKGHWHYMNPQIVAFNNQYLALRKEEHDDWCHHDFRSAAQDKYHTSHGCYFRHEHVWDLVKDEPGWISSIKSETSKVPYNYRTHINVSNHVVAVHPINANPVRSIDTNPVRSIDTNPVHPIEANPVCSIYTNLVHPIDTNPIRSIDSNSVRSIETNPVHPVVTNPVRSIDTNLAKEARKARCSTRKARLASDSQTIINMDDNVDVVHPIVTNVAEEATKEKSTPTSSSSKSRHDEIVEKHVEDYKKVIDRHYTLKEKKIRVEEEKLKIEEDKLKNKEIAILFMDPRKMADFAQEVWRNRCEEIKEKYKL